jgi:divinyl protochlorophyllide a 8-vinyl-reductase
MDGMPPSEARIGPNAITRVAEAAEARLGRHAMAAIFAEAGLSHHLISPPERMVPESDVTLLHRGLRGMLDVASARSIGREAGARTAAYLLANRVPGAMQLLLRGLPARIAAHVLLRAVARHSWTFAGGAGFHAKPGKPSVVSLEGCALCRGETGQDMLCDYYGATLEGLFRALVHRRTLATQTRCAARGDSECRFVLDW